MLDAIISNVRIIDGTGGPAYKGGVGIKDGNEFAGRYPGRVLKRSGK